MLRRLLIDESGQGMVEYGLIIALIAVAIVGALTLMKGGLSGVFDDITSKLGGAE